MGYKVAVAGATGNVGREVLSIMAERQFPADEVIALEPDPAMRRRLRDRAGSCAVPLTVSGAGADALPAATASR